MSQTIQFVPSNRVAPQFQVTLDEQIYTVIVTWNLAAQRYFINIYDLSGTLIMTRSLVGSPANFPIDLVAGYFQTSTLVFYQAAQQFVATGPSFNPFPGAV